MIKPLADRIVIKVIDDVQQTSGGIFIPDSAKEKPQKGEVVAVGTGKTMENGEKEPMEVKVGDVVKRGDVIARTSADALGTTMHASIDGKIKRIDNRFIVIER